MSANNAITAPALVIQFSRWPEPGKVKTRLAPLLGEQGAVSAHVALTMAVLRQLSASGLDLQLWWDRALAKPPVAAAPIQTALERRNITAGAQCSGNLGERMLNAMETGLQQYAKVIVVGSDCPSVDAAYVRQAAAALDNQDVVLGPAEDGGFVLVGARRVVPGMFEGLPWGTGQVLEMTRQQLARSGLTLSILPTRWDVDEPADWERYLSSPKG